MASAGGTVKWYDSARGFGFIAPDHGSVELFVHVSAVERAGLQKLNEGQRVSYDIEADRNGREIAVNLIAG